MLPTFWRICRLETKPLQHLQYDAITLRVVKKIQFIAILHSLSFSFDVNNRRHIYLLEIIGIIRTLNETTGQKRKNC